MVLNSGGDEHQAARFHRSLLVGDTNQANAADHVIDLVFTGRLLAVGRSARPDGELDAQLVRSEKVDVAVTIVVARLWIKLGDLVSVNR